MALIFIWLKPMQVQLLKTALSAPEFFQPHPASFEITARLQQALSGTAVFTTMEGQLRLQFIGDGRENIELCGEVADNPGGNRLQFTLQFDESQLGASIGDLERVTLQFPVRIA